MKVSRPALDVVQGFDKSTLLAIDEIINRSIQLLDREPVKKDTEFDTLWTLAGTTRAKEQLERIRNYLNGRNLEEETSHKG